MYSFPTQRCFTDRLLVHSNQSYLTRLAKLRLWIHFQKTFTQMYEASFPIHQNPISLSHVHSDTHSSPQLLSDPRSFLKPLLYHVSVTCALIAHNLCTDQWRLCYLLVGNCPLHQYSVCAGSNVASPGVLLMSLMCD